MPKIQPFPEPIQQNFYVYNQVLPSTPKPQQQCIIKPLSNKKYIILSRAQAIIADYKHKTVQKIDFSSLITSKYSYFHDLFSTKSGFTVAIDLQYFHFQNNQCITLAIKNTNPFFTKNYYFPESNILCNICKNELQVQSLDDLQGYYKKELDFRVPLQADDSSLFFLSSMGGQLNFFDIIERKLVKIKIKFQFTLFDQLLSIFLENQNSIYMLIKYDRKIQLYYLTQSKHQILDIFNTNEMSSLLIDKVSKKLGLIIFNAGYQTENIGRCIVYDYKNNKIVWDFKVKQKMSNFGSLWNNQFELFIKYDGYKDNNAVLTIYEGIRKNKLYIHLMKKYGLQKGYGTGIVKQVVKALN